MCYKLKNYTSVNFCKSAQYFDSAVKLKSAMLLINVHTCNFRESQSFAKNVKVKYSWTFLDLLIIICMEVGA